MRRKSILVKVILATLCAALFVVGCAPAYLKRPPQDAIDAYLLANPDLPRVDKVCIDEARTELGMLAETVRFLFGEPKFVEPIRQPWASQDNWHYKMRNKTIIFTIESDHVVGIDEQFKK